MEKLSRELFFRPNINFEVLKAEIQDAPICDLFKHDEFNLNLVHHSILARNATLVSILLQRLDDTEQGVENRVTLPYLHLAAIVGCSEIAAFLCKKFSVSTKESNFEWLQVIEECLRSKDSIRLSSTYSDENFFNVLSERMRKLLDNNHHTERSSALDIAALCGNTECLIAFLIGHPNSIVVNFSMLQKCIEVSSIQAFSHLLDHSPCNLHLRSFRYSIKHLNLDAIKVLLASRDELRITVNFSPYHLACVQSRSVNTTQHEKYKVLDDMFALFLEAGFDVNEKDFIGEYPLYSMIYSLVHEMDNNPRCVPEYHIRSLELLIKAGADPNYNELQAHQSSRCFTDRDLFSSALNAYFECLQSCETWSPIYMEHLDRVCLLLLENGADATYLNANHESPLHSLMRLAAEQHTLGHLSADFFSMTRQLLYFGADPNIHLPNESIPFTPIAYYFKNLFDNMGGQHAYDRWIQSEVLSQTLPIFTYMHRDVANQTIDIISTQLEQKMSEDEDLSRDMASHIKTNLKEYLGGVRSLQDCCKVTVWHAYNRQVTLIKKLGLPRSLIREFDSFFVLNF